MLLQLYQFTGSFNSSCLTTVRPNEAQQCCWKITPTNTTKLQPRNCVPKGSSRRIKLNFFLLLIHKNDSRLSAASILNSDASATYRW